MRIGVFKIGSDQASRAKTGDMDDGGCGAPARWCSRADAMFNADGVHVTEVRRGHRKLVITVETDADSTVDQGGLCRRLLVEF